MASFLQVDRLTKSYGDRLLFADITFGVNEGDKIGIIAKNGTGKSTLLKIIAGKEDCDSGKIVFRNGLRVGYLEQVPAMDGDLSVIDACMKGLHPSTDIDEEPLEERMKRMLYQLGVASTDALVSTLSGGQMKRAALARAIVEAPDLLILDEPTNHLDLSSQIELMQQLRLYGSQPNRQVIGVFHDLTLAPMLGGQAIFMREGQILRQGAFSDIASPSFLQQVYGVDVRAHLAKALEALPKA